MPSKRTKKRILDILEPPSELTQGVRELKEKLDDKVKEQDQSMYRILSDFIDRVGALELDSIGVKTRLDQLRDLIESEEEPTPFDPTELQTAITALEDSIISFQQNIELYATAEEVKETNKEIKRELDFLRRALGEHGGGSMNRQIKVAGVDVLTKFTDINLIGSGVTITASANATQKRTDITFAASGGVTSVTASNSTLTISPTTGAVLASVNTAGTFPWTGQHTFSSLAPIFATTSIGQIFYAGTGGVLQGNNAMRWDSTLLGMAINKGTAQPTATVDVTGGASFTITNASGLTLTLQSETLISAPTIAEITVSVYGQIDDDGGFTATNQVDLMSGGYTANGQTINYEIYAYKLVNGGDFYTALLDSTSFTDMINDGTTTFNVQIDWTAYTGADGYVIRQVDQNYSYFLSGGGTIAVKDLNGSFDSGFAVSTPSQTLRLSAGGTRNYRARGYALSPTNVNYYGPAYDYTLSEPTAGSYYAIQHDGIQNVAGSSSMYLYGAADGSTTFTNMALISGVPVTLYETLNSWGSSPFDIPVTQSPTSYGITGTGQTILYRLRAFANIRGYSNLFSATTTLSNNLTIPNTGLKYYVEAAVSTPPTFNGPTPVIQSTRYYTEKSANNGSTYPEYTSYDTGIAWVTGIFGYIDGTTSFAATPYTATPTSFIPAASVFKNSAGSTDPFSQSAGYELQTIFDNAIGGNTGAEWRTGGNRAFAMYATSNVATVRITGTFRISPISTDLQYLSLNATQMELGNTTTGYIFNMISPTYPSAFFYVNASTSNAFVAIGATSSAGVMGIVGNTNMTTRSYYFAQQHGSTNGDYFRGANSSGTPTAYLNNLANWSIGNGTNSVPAYSFVDDLDTGMYRVGANNLGFSTNAVLRLSIDTVKSRFATGMQWFAPRVVTAAGAVTVATTDYIVVVNKGTGAATTVNLPASPTAGDSYIIKDGKGDANTNNITITPAAGNIDGAGTFVMNINYQSTTLVYNGTEWNII